MSIQQYIDWQNLDKKHVAQGQVFKVQFNNVDFLNTF